MFGTGLCVCSWRPSAYLSSPPTADESSFVPLFQDDDCSLWDKLVDELEGGLDSNSLMTEVSGDTEDVWGV